MSATPVDKYLEELGVLNSISASTIIYAASDPSNESYQLAISILFTSPNLLGAPTATTPPGSDNSNRVATTQYVKGQISGLQPLNPFLTQVSNLGDPNSDQLVFWDDSAGTLTYLTLGSNLSITGTVLSVNTASLTGVVHTTGNETISGIKTFANPIVGTITGSITTAQVINLDTTLASKQPLDTTLSALAGLNITPNTLIYGTGPDAFALSTLTPFMRTLLDDPDLATAQATLGITTGPTGGGTPGGTSGQVQWNNNGVFAGFGSWNGTTLTVNAFAGSGAAFTGVVHSTGDETISGNKTFSSPIVGTITGNITQGQVTGLNTALAGKQSLDSTLTALAGVTTAANTLIYATGVDTFATTTLTPFIRTLLDDIDPATARATLGVDVLLAGKQPTGSYITDLIGDVLASGPGSATATLANSGVTAGTYTNSNIEVDAKGRVIAASNGSSGTGGAPTSPGGSSGNIQYNAAGGFGGFGNWTGSVLSVPGSVNASKLISTGGAADYSFQTGTMGLQGFGTNNCWVADNLYFDGAAWKYKNNGYGALLYFAGGGFTFQVAPLNSSGPDVSAASTPMVMSISRIGDVVIVGSLTVGGMAYPLNTIELAQVQASGDSMTYGSGLADPTNTSYPALLAGLLGSGYLVTNQGRPGWTLDQLAVLDATTIDPIWSWQRPVNICSIWAGRNDLYFGTSVSTLIANYPVYCRARKKAGYLVIAWTMLPGVPVGSWTTADQQTFNTFMRANWSQFSDALFDVAAIPGLQDPTGPNFQSDGVHPNEAGQVLIAQGLYNVVLDIYNRRYMHLTGNETIAGDKTFTGNVTAPVFIASGDGSGYMVTSRATTHPATHLIYSAAGDFQVHDFVFGGTILSIAGGTGAAQFLGQLTAGGKISSNVTNDYAFQSGTMGMQGFATNGCWLADNVFFDGSGFKYKADGKGVLLYFTGGGFQIVTAPSGIGGTTATLSTAFDLSPTGDLLLPGTVTASNVLLPGHNFRVGSQFDPNWGLSVYNSVNTYHTRIGYVPDPSYDRRAGFYDNTSSTWVAFADWNADFQVANNLYVNGTLYVGNSTATFNSIVSRGTHGNTHILEFSADGASYYDAFGGHFFRDRSGNPALFIAPGQLSVYGPGSSQFNWAIKAGSDASWGFSANNVGTEFSTRVNYYAGTGSDHKAGFYDAGNNLWVAYADDARNFQVVNNLSVGGSTITLGNSSSGAHIVSTAPYGNHFQLEAGDGNMYFDSHGGCVFRNTSGTQYGVIVPSYASFSSITGGCSLEIWGQSTTAYTPTSQIFLSNSSNSSGARFLAGIKGYTGSSQNVGILSFELKKLAGDGDVSQVGYFDENGNFNINNGSVTTGNGAVADLTVNINSSGNSRFVVQTNAVISKLQNIEGAGYAQVGTQSNHDFHIIVNNAQVVRFDTGGNQTMSGTVQADHFYAHGANAGYFFDRRDTQTDAWYIYSPTGNFEIVNVAAGTTFFSIDPSGNSTFTGNVIAQTYTTAGPNAGYSITRRDTNASTHVIYSASGDFQVHSFAAGGAVFYINGSTNDANFIGDVHSNAYYTNGAGAGYYLSRRDTSTIPFIIYSAAGDFQVHNFAVGTVFNIDGSTNVATFVGTVVSTKVGDYAFQAGTMGLQSAGTNNCWLGDNFYYDSGWKYKNNGYAAQLYFIGGGVEVRLAPNNIYGPNIGATPVQALRVETNSNLTVFGSTILLGTTGTGAALSSGDTHNNVLLLEAGDGSTWLKTNGGLYVRDSSLNAYLYTAPGYFGLTAFSGAAGMALTGATLSANDYVGQFLFSNSSVTSGNQDLARVVCTTASSCNSGMLQFWVRRPVDTGATLVGYFYEGEGFTVGGFVRAATIVTGAGVTSASPTGQQIGAMWFDISFGVPVWWNGTAWVNASGGSGSNTSSVPYSFSGGGISSVANDVAAWLYVDKASTAYRLSLSCKTPPTGNFQVSIKRSSNSGATFPDTIATVTVSSGSRFATTTTITIPALAAGDLLGLDINSVNGAADWSVRLMASG